MPFFKCFRNILFEYRLTDSSVAFVKKMLLMVLLSLCRFFTPNKTAHGSITFYIQAVGGFPAL